MRVLIAATFAAAFALASAPAEACFSSYDEVSRVVGVSPRGEILVFATSVSDNDEDGPDRAFELYDAHGHHIEKLEETSHARDDGEGFEVRWSDAPVEPYEAQVLALPDDLAGASPAAVEAHLVRHLRLTRLVPSRRVARHDASTDTHCGSIVMKTAQGWARVLEVGILDFSKDRCVPVQVEAMEHPASPMLFVRARWSIVDPPTDLGTEEHARVDAVQWFPRRRVDGIERALAGERALAEGRPAAAAELLTRAIELEPAYVPSYELLARAYARSGADPADLAATLMRPVSKEQYCLGSRARDVNAYLAREAPAHLAGAFDWSSLAPQPPPGECSLHHENYLGTPWQPSRTAEPSEAGEEAPADVAAPLPACAPRWVVTETTSASTRTLVAADAGPRQATWIGLGLAAGIAIARRRSVTRPIRLASLLVFRRSAYRG
jgi:hypothetical protein